MEEGGLDGHDAMDQGMEGQVLKELRGFGAGGAFNYML